MKTFIAAAALMGATVNALAFQRSTGICGSTSTTNHTIVSGDTLTALAKQFNSGICDIATLNHISNPNVVYPGEVLTIPVNCTTPDNTSCVSVTYPVTWTCVPGPPNTYDIRTNDTLSAIATNFNITLAALEGANSQIANFDLIYPGQIIHIPVCPCSSCLFKTYDVQSGDIFYDLAQKYGSTTGQILAANVGVDPTKLAVGQQVILPSDCQNGTDASAY